MNWTISRDFEVDQQAKGDQRARLFVLYGFTLRQIRINPKKSGVLKADIRPSYASVVHTSRIMARKAQAGSSQPSSNKSTKLTQKKNARVELSPEVDASDEEQYDEADLDALEYGDDVEEEGIAQWAPDDWDGEDSEGSLSQSGSELGEEEDDEADGGQDLVRPSHLKLGFTNGQTLTPSLAEPAPGGSTIDATVDSDESPEIAQVAS